MSLTAFQRYRRMKQVEEMKPENLAKKEEPALENFTAETLVPEEVPEENPQVEEKPLVPEETEEKVEIEPEKEETKTANRRKGNK